MKTGKLNVFKAIGEINIDRPNNDDILSALIEDSDPELMGTFDTMEEAQEYVQRTFPVADLYPRIRVTGLYIAVINEDESIDYDQGSVSPLKEWKCVINSDSFGDEVPVNWEEIAEYLNEKLRDGEDPDDVWENYWHGDYADAPEAIMEQEKKSRFYLYSVTVELKDRPGSAWDVIDCPEESRNLISVFDDADEAAEALRQKQPEIRIDKFPGYYRCTTLMVVEYLETVENGEVADREDMGLSEFSQMPKDGGQ